MNTTAKIKLALLGFLLWGLPASLRAVTINGGGTAGSGITVVSGATDGNLLAYDSASGNSRGLTPFTSYYTDLQLVFPQRTQGTNATLDTAAQSDDNYGMAVFSNSVSSETNWVEYKLQVPVDIDTTTDLGAYLKIRLSGADTGTHRYVLDMGVVADSAGTPASFSNAVNLDFAGDASGASGDWETISLTTLTGWKTALASAAGQLWVIRLMRDGDAAQDASTVNSSAFPILRCYRTRPD